MSAQATLSAIPFTSSGCTGEVVPVEIRIDVAGDAINAAQGVLRYDSAQLRVASISTGRSVFRFWQTEPTVNAQQGAISFAGGLPTPGFVGEGGVLFTVNVVPLRADADVRLSWDASTQVLLNDGAGTPASVAMQGARISVSEAESATCLAPRATPTPIVDTVSPEPFDVVITRTEDAFRGQYFASYYAYDHDSGVVGYEVRENGESWHSERSPYTLRTQEGRVLLEVKAIDAAGNQRISSASAELARATGIGFGPWWFWLVVLFAGALAIWRIVASRKNNRAKAAIHTQQKDTDEIPRVTYDPGSTTL